MDDGRYDKGILNARRTGEHIRLWVTGGDHQHDTIAKALRNLTALPHRTTDGSNESQVPLTWAIVTQCAQLMAEYEQIWHPDPELVQWIKAEFLRRYSNFGSTADLTYPVTSMSRTPMPHQLSGMYLGALNKRYFFGDDAGTGKTMTALLTLAELDARGESPWPVFVVCPASVVDPWMEELEKVFPDWPATVYRGPKRKSLSSRYKIYVMSWDTFRIDMKHPSDDLPPLLKFNRPRTVIYDEAHALCNTTTKQSIAARQLARVVPFVFPMSGTPITGNIAGFWSAMCVLDTRSFPDQKRYKNRYTNQYRKEYGPDEVEGLTTVHRKEFYTLMQGSMRHVAKQDVLTDLPPKTYNTRVVEIPPAFRAAYDEMRLDMLAHIPGTDEPLPVMNTLSQLQRLSQLASSACDVEIEEILDENPESPTYGEYIKHYKVTMREPSWKVDELMVKMEGMDIKTSPIICFTPHTQLLHIAGARAEAAGYRVGYIIGGQAAGKRTGIRTAFQNGELDLLCSNTKAGGVGLTLTRSHDVVFLEREWGYWRGSQNEDRSHRAGQTEQVTVTDIVAANTVEARVRVALKDKAQQLSDLVRDPRIVAGLLGGEKLRV